MLDLYGVGGDQWDELIEMTREVRRKGWWRAYGMGDNAYVGFENEASRAHEFTLLYFPGLLQIPEYSRALFVAAGVHRTPNELADQVAVRTIRQRRLTSEEHPLELLAVVDEAALQRTVGGPEVQRAQLRHVISATVLPSVTLLVLPASAGAHAGMASAFTILSFDHLGEPDIVYVEHAVGAIQLEKDADVSRARMVFDRLRSAALDPDESVARLREAAAQL
jgi:hypothetical protein